MKNLVLSSGVVLDLNGNQLEVRDSSGDLRYATEHLAVKSFLKEISRATNCWLQTGRDLESRLNVDESEYLNKEIETLKSRGLISTGYLAHRDFSEALKAERKEMPFLKYDDWGMTVSNCGKEALSKGCQSCKDGSWICVFPGFSCNAKCKFCPRLTEDMVEQGVMDQGAIEVFLASIADRSDEITGVSVSGGEIFFDNYEATKEIVGRLRKAHPHLYLWAYTNGIAATESNMRELRDLGLDEMRFNLAATKFNQKIVSKIKEYAVDIFPWVTVEIPIYRESFEFLIEKGQLKALDEIGVKQLNLAEVRVPYPESTDERFISPAEKHFLESEVLYEYERMSIKVLTVASSRMLTNEVFKFAQENQLGIRINDCSQDAKFFQIAGRTARELNDISTDVDAFAGT